MNSKYSGITNDHFDGRKFFNPTGPAGKKSVIDLLKWRFGESRAPWPKWVENKTVPNIPSSPGPEDLIVTFINHATVLVQIQGKTFLTDPVYSKRVSPFSWMGPKRHRDPGVPFEQLPKIDYVLISHNHYDHLDVDTIRRLEKAHHPRFFVALGDADLLRDIGVASVMEMDWWQTVLLDDVELSFVPAKHWSGRAWNDHFDSLWGGFFVKGRSRSLYYSGDAGYSRHFKEIRDRLGAPEVALLPIGSYEPRWFMKEHHMNPEEAVQAHLDLGASHSVGIHFGTFQLTDESIDAPIEELESARQKMHVSSEQFFVLQEGESKRIQKGVGR